MSKIRRGVVLVLLTVLFGTPVLAAEQPAVAPSPMALLTNLWTEVLEVLEQVLSRVEDTNEFGELIEPNG